ncbi:CRISPR-associated endonuclease Cas3'' [Nocardia farcinica]|uniref:CRISPR-associated endonuclease Cas3'' n=1 Tax=Nocardia farcinica TaxID=37329 RepID=UPI003CC7CE7F
MLGTATLSAWAKSDREGGSLSLVRHLADSGEVAKLVWDRWLPAHTRQRISVGLPGGEADGRTLLVWLAATHDIGKLTPAFACQVPVLADAMHDRGLRMPDALGDRKALPHSLAGEVTVLEFLTGLGWDREVAKTYAVVVGSHHGVPPTVREERRTAPRVHSPPTRLGAGRLRRPPLDAPAAHQRRQFRRRTYRLEQGQPVPPSRPETRGGWGCGK